MTKTEHLIKQYDLQRHPEGGWFKQTYKSTGIVPATALPAGFGGDRVFSTATYFLLEKGDFSAFHKIKSDECWHFYAGDPLHVFVIDHIGDLQIITLGNNINNGETFQFVVPANCWFASRPANDSEFCMVGCTVAPGFEFEDLEMADVKSLAALYPSYASIIRDLCR
jgi:predicted cupin superfamily sugar epimerase